MAKIIVKCHAAPGFDAVWAGQRRWPATGTEVETVSEEGDSEGTPDSPLFKLGTRTLTEMEQSGRFSFGISGTIEEIEGIKAENAALKERVAELEAENAALKAGADNGEGNGKKKK